MSVLEDSIFTICAYYRSISYAYTLWYISTYYILYLYIELKE